MSIKHTDEPWELIANGPCFNVQSAFKKKHHMILVGMEYNDPTEHAANCQRIIDCVNACKGIEDPAAFIEKALAQGIAHA